jgi:ubiquitin-conjugating enzyme E2 J2
MGEKERGIPDPSIPVTPSHSPLHPSQPPLSETGSSAIVRPHVPPTGILGGHPSGSGKVEGVGWTAPWQKMIWDKWRWGVLIALAVLVSRFSSSS